MVGKWGYITLTVYQAIFPMFAGRLSLNEDALLSTAPYDPLPGAHLCAHPADFFRDCERAGVKSGSPPGSTTGRKIGDVVDKYFREPCWVSGSPRTAPMKKESREKPPYLSQIIY